MQDYYSLCSILIVYLKKGGIISGVDKAKEFGDVIMIKEFRNRFKNKGLKSKNNLATNAEEIDEVEKVKIQKYKNSDYVCVFCGGTKSIRLYCGKYICGDCYKDLKKLYKSKKRKR